MMNGKILNKSNDLNKEKFVRVLCKSRSTNGLSSSFYEMFSSKNICSG